MIISDIKVHKINIPLNTPFKISDSTQTTYNGILLELITEDGTIGWGEAAPSERVTGETCKAVTAAIEDQIKSLVIGKPIDELEQILTPVEKILSDKPSALCALDIALHDLKGKNANLPVKLLLGGYRENIPISFTVVIGTVDESVKSASEYIEKGAKVLKVKLGVDPEEDIARIKALRDTFGYDIKITGDANQGYPVAMAIRTLSKLCRYELEFVEQPVDADDIIGLKEVHKSVDMPIMADEAACSVADVLNLVKQDAVDMINIKLMKCGGLRNAVKISNITEAAGIPCQIGCMIETGIGITAGTHLALALKNIKYADLDGHIFLTHDVVTDHQITNNGLNTISGRPGLGVKVKI
jgi:o-succinylbenzoate synthase